MTATLQINWKEMISSWSGQYPNTCLEGLSKTSENLRIVGVVAEIQIEHLQNRNLGRYLRTKFDATIFVSHISRSCRFPPEERVRGINCIGGWVNSKAGLDDVEKRTFFSELRRVCCPTSSQLPYRLNNLCCPVCTTEQYKSCSLFWSFCYSYRNHFRAELL
jgi:hypothetical protein